MPRTDHFIIEFLSLVSSDEGTKKREHSKTVTLKVLF